MIPDVLYYTANSPYKSKGWCLYLSKKCAHCTIFRLYIGISPLSSPYWPGTLWNSHEKNIYSALILVYCMGRYPPFVQCLNVRLNAVIITKFLLELSTSRLLNNNYIIKIIYFLISMLKIILLKQLEVNMCSTGHHKYIYMHTHKSKLSLQNELIWNK